MYQWSPACQVHAMPVERLREADVTFYSAWSDGTLAACGALKQLGDNRGELKSMRAAPDFRGKGAGEAILLYLVSEAKRRGYCWLGLETGGTKEFLPAQRLYEKHGFSKCPAFGNYVSDEFSLCMSREL
ncbi:GNAT family N-acetyltransferase [Altererythrobacter aquaemixtae]|uniref:GNAT family N-acetyltransferase n=2 Tax=Pontixanthobacter aquaemixtae TaxID=1958940 RepID=A0A844ZVP1_9SPHN|nr:GNAT family N-acetyltransferase [Pontixanthobacter aquaemixtae]